jgi:glycosyltransferase involved in cell wall biosynthesis
VRVAYFTNQYPAVSHTFIRREIRAIEALGAMVFRYALRPGLNLVDLEDKREEQQTRYILRGGAEMARCSFAMLLTRPLKTVKAIIQAIRMGWRSDRGILRHLFYVMEATVLAHWCRRDAIQHVHAHFGTNSAAIAMLAWRFSGIPYSFTAHGPDEFIKWPNIALAEEVRYCVFVVAISSYTRSQLYRYIEHTHWHKVKVVHCGLEPAAFAAAENPGTGVRRFICIGRLVPEKGHFLLMEAARQLAEQGEDFEMVLVGDGQMRADIETLARRYNLQDRLRIVGWIDGRQVREEILAARALVQPSFAEGLPVVIMEAMALKRPIISTLIAGIPELVHADEHGWLVPAGDVEALVQAMRACLDTSTETLARMGEAAYRRVFLLHNVETEASKLADLFTSSVKNSELIGPVAGSRRKSGDNLTVPIDQGVSHGRPNSLSTTLTACHRIRSSVGCR